MRTYIITNGIEKPVKNLGWLIRHASKVERIFLSDRDDGAKCGCKFVARLMDGRIYTTSFNSYEICKDWISRRRNLRGVIVTDIVNLLG
jgi:hypothetical protein